MPAEQGVHTLNRKASRTWSPLTLYALSSPNLNGSSVSYSPAPHGGTHSPAEQAYDSSGRTPPVPQSNNVGISSAIAPVINKIVPNKMSFFIFMSQKNGTYILPIFKLSGTVLPVNRKKKSPLLPQEPAQ